MAVVVATDHTVSDERLSKNPELWTLWQRLNTDSLGHFTYTRSSDHRYCRLTLTQHKVHLQDLVEDTAGSVHDTRIIDSWRPLILQTLYLTAGNESLSQFQESHTNRQLIYGTSKRESMMVKLSNRIQIILVHSLKDSR